MQENLYLLKILIEVSLFLSFLLNPTLDFSLSIFLSRPTIDDEDHPWCYQVEGKRWGFCDVTKAGAEISVLVWL